MNDQDKIQNDVRNKAIVELTQIAHETGLPFIFEDDVFSVFLPPEVGIEGQREDQDLD